MAVLVEESDGVFKDIHECLVCRVAVKAPYIRCCQCDSSVDLCLECFAKGGKGRQHSSDHKYEIVSYKFSLLEKSWSAQEELKLLDALSDCGFGNWKEVTKRVQSKTEEDCEEHYLKCYINEPCKDLQLPVLRVVPACTSLVSTKGIPFKASEDPPRPTMDTARSMELSGYMPCRGDFEVEYDNYAEMDIKDIEMDTTDSDLLHELKIAAIEIFLTRLRQRFYRKQIVRRYGLINIRKWQMLGRRQSKTERDLHDCLRPFARLQSPEEHELLVQGLLMEVYLKKEILRLQQYRSAGIRTLKGAEVYERLNSHREEQKGNRRMLDDILIHVQDEKACQAWLQRQAQIEAGQTLAPLPLPNLVPRRGKRKLCVVIPQLLTHALAGRKPAARLDISGTPGVEQLTPMERELCSSLRLLPHDYQNYKSTLTKECQKLGFLRLAQARTLIRIDVNKTRKMYNFFVEQGWIKQPDG